MPQIIINELEFSYKEYVNPIFKNINLNIDTSWKLGLIGRNGRGKSTLLKLINGDLQPDKGTVINQVKTEIFPYDYSNKYQITYDVILENMGKLKSLEDEMERISGDVSLESISKYNNLLSCYIDNDGFTAESRIKKELPMLDLSDELLWRDFSSLSGGEQTKILLLALFLRSNCFALLDEPSNHLDIVGKKVLSNYLKKKRGFILVSHDRELLDEVVDHIISINRNSITIEKGNYSTWKNNIELNEAYELRTKVRLEREINSLHNSAENSRKWSGTIEKTRSDFAGNARGHDSRSAALMRRAKASEKKIKKNYEEKKDLLKNYEHIVRLKLEQKKSPDHLITLNNIYFSYGDNEVISNFSLEINSGDIIWIKGKNGIGKSTLLKLINGELSPCSGSVIRNSALITAMSHQDCMYSSGMISNLFATKEELTKCKSICAYLDISGEQFMRPLETFSSGELKKFGIAQAMSVKNNLLLLDEPLNYMDIHFREQLQQAILEHKPTIVFVEHDEWFGNSVANKKIFLNS